METLSYKKTDETPHPEIDDLVQDIVRWEMRAISRAIHMVENRMEGSERLLDALHTHVGNAHRIALTGPPGRVSILNASGKDVIII